MKQLLTILLLFPLFIACSSDDDNNHGDTLEEQIVGTWISTVQNESANILVFSKDKTVRWYNNSTKEDPILDTGYTVYADAVKFAVASSGSTYYCSANVIDGILELTVPLGSGVNGKLYFKRK